MYLPEDNNLCDATSLLDELLNGDLDLLGDVLLDYLQTDFTNLILIHC